ncbi:MAG: hypothetical protein ACXVZU_03495, partial [Methanobacteriaceae archaeon]
VNEVLNDHNGVYLEKRLYLILKKEFPDLTRNHFQDILNKFLRDDYVMQHGLIKRLPHNKSKIAQAGYAGTKQGKGAADVSRRPDKKGL